MKTEWMALNMIGCDGSTVKETRKLPEFLFIIVGSQNKHVAY